jgi:alpha-mannosidase
VVLAGVVRRAFDLTACGFSRHVTIDRWVMNVSGSVREARPPLVIECSPSDTVLLEAGIEVPDPQRGAEWLLKLVLGGNALVELDGAPIGGYDEAHTYFRVPPGYHRVAVRASPRSLFGQHAWTFEFKRALLVEASLRVIKTGLWVLQLVDYVNTLPESSPLRRELTRLLLEVTGGLRLSPSPRQIALAMITLYEGPAGVARGDIYRPLGDYIYLKDVYGVGILRGLVEEPPGNYTSLSEALEVASDLEVRILEGLSRLREEHPEIGTLHVVSHSHIDAAWLWPRSETVEKVLRTFSTIVSLAREYEFTYIQSSAQYYEWLEERSPQLFDEVKRLVESGRWIIAGGMWVESDTNLVTGESLARQFLYGQRYFKSRFGRVARIGFLPDSFGFSANLPQVLRKSGLEVFVTHKVMWNDTTEFPHHTFRWRGIDGTEIPVQVIVSSYGEPLSLRSIYRHWERYRDKGVALDLIYTYGYSDGGGGPTREMLFNYELARVVPGLPALRHLREEEYVEALKKASASAPVYEGEMYLEFHRGTYTTNLAIKDLVARAERLLVSAEIALSVLELGFNMRADWSVLKGYWKELLFAEFHDVLPGSSIREVYEDANRELEGVVRALSKAVQGALSSVGGGGGGYVAVFNPLPWPRRALIEIPAELGSVEGYECQDAGGKRLVLVTDLAPSGVKTYRLSGECRASGGVVLERSDEGVTVKNEHVSIAIGVDGSIKSIKLRGGVELLREPSTIVAHPDTPGYFDAWEVTDEFLARGEVVEALDKPRVVLQGPLVACVEVLRGYGASKITQTICVEKGSPIVEIKTLVDWRDKSVLLKHWFKTTMSGMRAFYEVPFGVVERPTRSETPRERAMFEVPAVSWADFTNGVVGLAVIAPSRHGYSTRGGDFSLSLLRSPTFPNPWSDLGRYEFTYYLYPHSVDYEVAEVPRVASEVAFSVFTRPVSSAVEYSLLSIQPPRVLLSAFKRSEDGDGYIARLYNPYSSSVEVTVKYGFKVKSIHEVDIPELNVIEPLGEGELSTAVLKFKPFEVKTLKLLTLSAL